jgi:spore coat polysaccharide biosynthesis protein SpsF
MPPAEPPKTDPEALWRGAFGDEYTERNAAAALVRANVALFARILARAPGVRSIVELGCNRGANLEALHALDPALSLSAYEINTSAAAIAAGLGVARVRCESILDLDLKGARPSDLAFTKGVLIHIDPDKLERAYAALDALSRRYVVVCEYYNPSPTMVPYRGTTGTLFKRDFAGELIDRFGLALVDYGFAYHRDPTFPQDDCTWFLLEKR